MRRHWESYLELMRMGPIRSVVFFDLAFFRAGGSDDSLPFSTSLASRARFRPVSLLSAAFFLGGITVVVFLRPLRPFREDGVVSS